MKSSARELCRELVRSGEERRNEKLGSVFAG